MTEKTIKHRQIWQNKIILREVYKDWYRQIIKDLSPANGPTIELGAGSGNFKEFKSDIIATDIENFDWLDMSFDAHEMPFNKDTVANIVLIDVLHHLNDPIRFFEEAKRVLMDNGRLLIIEPFPSLISLPFYRRFHSEPFIFSQDFFHGKAAENKDPWQSNQATSYILFFKLLNLFLEKFKIFFLVKRERFSVCHWPASGGFDHEQIAPDWSIPLLRAMEVILYPFRPWLAWRCYIVLTKKESNLDQ